MNILVLTYEYPALGWGKVALGIVEGLVVKQFEAIMRLLIEACERKQPR